MTPPKKKSQEAEESPTVEPGEELAQALREASESVTESEPAEGPPSPEPDPEEKIAAQAAELEQAQDRLVRLQAEFENFRRRSLKERQESLQYGHQNLVKDLLAAWKAAQ